MMVVVLVWLWLLLFGCCCCCYCAGYCGGGGSCYGCCCSCGGSCDDVVVVAVVVVVVVAVVVVLPVIDTLLLLLLLLSELLVNRSVPIIHMIYIFFPGGSLLLSFFQYMHLCCMRPDCSYIYSGHHLSFPGLKKRCAIGQMGHETEDGELHEVLVVPDVSIDHHCYKLLVIQQVHGS